jgi:DNA gyrase subunit A
MAAPFEFSEVQAEHILDMQLARLTRLGRADLEEEMAKLRQTISELESHPRRPGGAARCCQDELGEIRASFASPRRAVVTFDPGEMAAEDLIDDERARRDP